MTYPDLNQKNQAMKLFKVILLSLLVLQLICRVSSNENDIRTFLNNVLECLEQIQREATDSFVRQRLHRELGDHIQTLSGILSISRFVDDARNREAVNTLQSLNGWLIFLLTAYETRQGTTSENRLVLLPPPLMTCSQGRPRYSISREQISHLVSLGMNWQSIATCLGVSSRTLYRHREDLGIEPLTYATLSDENLNRVVREILQYTTNAGERYVHGSLRSRGLRIQRWRVRQSLQEIDPFGRSLRRRNAIRRRLYSVPFPNQLW